MVHTLSSSFVLGYHGCDARVAEKLLAGENFKPSDNEYDWLGPGIYFWEANPKRGLEYAGELKKLSRGPRIRTPAVVGAVIDLGLCLDLTTSAGLQQVRDTHSELLKIFDTAARELPSNSADLLRRNLDCAVIRLLHDIRNKQGHRPVDTIKGIFVEGNPIYDSAGFYEKTHSQICVCNPDCIKAVFWVYKRFLN